MKKVLFLGNSFTYFYDLPSQVKKMSGGAIACHSITRGGAYLNAYKTASDELRIRLDELLVENEYDYVVLQEQSLNAIVNFDDYLSSVMYIKGLVGKAEVLIYQTWSYKDGSSLLESVGMTYSDMCDRLEAAAKRAAEAVDGTVIPVGRAFSDTVKAGVEIELYDPDCLHPSEAGTSLAAKLFFEFLCK